MCPTRSRFIFSVPFPSLSPPLHPNSSCFHSHLLLPFSTLPFRLLFPSSTLPLPILLVYIIPFPPINPPSSPTSSRGQFAIPTSPSKRPTRPIRGQRALFFSFHKFFRLSFLLHFILLFPLPIFIIISAQLFIARTKKSRCITHHFQCIFKKFKPPANLETLNGWKEGGRGGGWEKKRVGGGGGGGLDNKGASKIVKL